MRAPFLPLLLASGLLTVPSLHAFPQNVARIILGRPITTEHLEKEFGALNAFLDPIIEASDAISVSQFEVGDPSVKLSVLIVEPRHYGIAVEDKIDLEALKFSVNFTAKAEGNPPESLRKQLEEAKADSNGEKNPEVPIENLEVPLKQVVGVLKEQVRIGGRIPSTTRPRTLFLLNGYGVSKKMGLPLALLLGEHGIRTVMPDLRGQGESSGSGVTWGKQEPGDLADLLTALQAKGVVEQGPVAVLGISYGAAMASLWSARDERVRTTILVAPYQRADTKIVTAYDQFLGGVKLPFLLSDKMLTEGTKVAAKKLQVSWEEISPAEAVKDIDSPVLFMASTGDEIIPPNEVAEMHGNAPSGSKLHLFEKLPHLLLGINFTEMESLVMDWLDNRPAQ